MSIVPPFMTSRSPGAPHTLLSVTVSEPPSMLDRRAVDLRPNVAVTVPPICDGDRLERRAASRLDRDLARGRGARDVERAADRDARDAVDVDVGAGRDRDGHAGGRW